MVSFDELFERHISRIEGWLSAAEARKLFELARVAEDGAIVEIGSYHGKSTVAIAAGNLAGNKLPFYSVDPHSTFVGSMGGIYGPTDRTRFLANILDAGMAEGVSIVGLRSVAAARAIEGPLALLWIDGDHSVAAVLSDIYAWSSKVRIGGVIVLDDITGTADGPRSALKRLLQNGWAMDGEVIGKIAVLRREPNTAMLGRSATKLEARDLLTASRFDLGAKIPFALEYAEGHVSGWTRWIYLLHIWVWNNFYEAQPPKRSSKDFLDAFVEILDAAATCNESLNESLLPLACDGTAMNGAHRIAAAFAYGRRLSTVSTEVDGGLVQYNFEYFDALFERCAAPLQRVAYHEMIAALFGKCFTGRLLVLFPSPDLGPSHVVDAMGSRRIIAKLTLDLSSTELREKFIHLLYEGEAWVGDDLNQYSGVRHKSSECFAHGTEVVVFLVDRVADAELVMLKTNLRRLAGRENHSVHSSDSFADAHRIIRSILFDPGLRFYLRSTPRFPNFARLFEKFRTAIISKKLESKVIVTGSAVLAALGIRDCRDIDYVSKTRLELVDAELQPHGAYAALFPLSINTLLSASCFTFWFDGIRFLRPELLKEFKAIRGEPKDSTDVESMSEFSYFYGSELDFWKDQPVLIISCLNPGLGDVIASILSKHPDACSMETFGLGKTVVVPTFRVAAEDHPHLAPCPIVPSAFTSAEHIPSQNYFSAFFRHRPRMRILVVDGGEAGLDDLASATSVVSSVQRVEMSSADILGYPESFLQGMANFLWIYPDPCWIREGVKSIHPAVSRRD